jgi:hypothetical protein
MRNVAALAVDSSSYGRSAAACFFVGMSLRGVDYTLSRRRSSHTVAGEQGVDVDKKAFTVSGLLSMESACESRFIYLQLQDLNERIKWLKAKDSTVTPLQCLLSTVAQDLIDEGYVAKRFSEGHDIKPCFYMKKNGSPCSCY